MYDNPPGGCVRLLAHSRKGVFLMLTPDNLARKPVVETLDEAFLREVICHKSRGMVHIVARFHDKKGGYMRLLRCDYAQNLLMQHCGSDGRIRPPLADDLHRVNQHSCPPDVYYSVATFRANKRGVRSLHAMRGLFVDLDNHDDLSALDIESAKAMAFQLQGDAASWGLPLPWVVYTGRGLHLVWVFRDAVPVDDKHKQQRKKLQYTLEQVGVWAKKACESYNLPIEYDAQSCNLGRLLRVPGTHNSKTIPGRGRGVMARVIARGDACAWADFKPLTFARLPAPPAAQATPVVDVLPTPAVVEAVGRSRLERLEAWASGRGWDIKGHREMWLHLCALMLLAGGAGEAETLEQVRALNKRLRDPLRDVELTKAVRCDAKYRYQYSNAKIAEVLDMDEAEAEAFGLGSLPSGYAYGGPRLTAWELANLTGQDTRTQNRRRDAGRAERKSAKASKYAQIPGLLAQGLSLSAVAKQLGLSKSTVDRHRGGE